MKITVLALFKSRCAHCLSLEQEYLKRIPKGTVTIQERIAKESTSQSVVEIQSRYDQILEESNAEYRIVLDERGVPVTSLELARIIDTKRTYGPSQIQFAVGGPHGWNDRSRGRADLLLSLSALTLPAHLARVFLVEQLYRSFEILTGSSYHK